MTKVKRYQVQTLEDGDGAVDGLEFLADPIGRRLYRGGEVVEIAVGSAVDVNGLLARGIIRPYSGPLLTARPAACPACGEEYVNAPGTEATCYHCGVAYKQEGGS